VTREQRRQRAQDRADQRFRARYYPEADDDDGHDVPGWAAVAAGAGLFVVLIGYAAGIEYLTRWLSR